MKQKSKLKAQLKTTKLFYIMKGLKLQTMITKNICTHQIHTYKHMYPC